MAAVVATSAGRRSSVTIGIVAGEASGDSLAAMLIGAVKERVPNARFVGVAGPRMEQAGCEAWYPLETLSVRGFVEVLSRLPRATIRTARRRTLADRRPRGFASERIHD